LLLEIPPHGGLVAPDRAHPVAPRPKVLPHKIPPLAPVGPRDVNGTRNP
jgi:hypothetical protein